MAAGVIAVIGPDRLQTLRAAEARAGNSAKNSSGPLTAADIDAIILPELQKAHPATLTLANIDLSSEPVRQKLLKTLEEQHTPHTIIVTSASTDGLGTPLHGRCAETIHIEAAQQQHPWGKLGPLATLAAESEGKKKKAFLTLALVAEQDASMRTRIQSATDAVTTLAKDDSTRQVGGRKALIGALTHTQEQAWQSRLQEAGTDGEETPQGEAGSARAKIQTTAQLSRLYEEAEHAAATLEAVRKALPYNPATRPTVAAILSAHPHD